MREDRIAFIEYWANIVKTNPGWKKEHKKFINSQITRSRKFYARLLRTENGVEKVISITGCKPSFAQNLKDTISS
jgi:hypothetical protein